MAELSQYNMILYSTLYNFCFSECAGLLVWALVCVYWYGSYLNQFLLLSMESTDSQVNGISVLMYKLSSSHKLLMVVLQLNLCFWCAINIRWLAPLDGFPEIKKPNLSELLSPCVVWVQCQSLGHWAWKFSNFFSSKFQSFLKCIFIIDRPIKCVGSNKIGKKSSWQ